MGITKTEFTQEPFIFKGHTMPCDSQKFTRNMSLRDAFDIAKALGCKIKLVNSNNDYHVSHPILLPGKRGVPVSPGRKDISAAMLVMIRSVYNATNDWRRDHPDELDTKAARASAAQPKHAVPKLEAPAAPKPQTQKSVKAFEIGAHFGQIAAFLHYQTCCTLGDGTMMYTPFKECTSPDCRKNRKMLDAIRDLDSKINTAYQRAEQAEAKAEAKIAEIQAEADQLVEEALNADKQKLTTDTDATNAWFWSFRNEISKEWVGAPQVLTRLLLILDEMFEKDDEHRQKLQACITTLDFTMLTGYFRSHTRPGNERKTFGFSAWTTFKKNLASMERRRRL